MKLQQYYEIQTDLLRLERRSEEVAERLKQAKYDLRCIDDKLLNYQGSIRSFLDKISGEREEKLETLRRQVRNAEASILSLKREQEALKQQREELTQVLATLPPLEALRAEAEKEWASLEVKFCAEALIPLLEANHKSLLEYRSLMQGRYPEILSAQRQQEICAEPNRWAQQCSPLLLRLKEAVEIQGKSFELGAYYESPVSYLVNVAARHNRLDRVNQALNQVEALQKQINKL